MGNKYRITLNLGHDLPPFKEDQVVEVPDDLNQPTADRLVRRNLAVKLELPKEKAESKPKKPVVGQFPPSIIDQQPPSIIDKEPPTLVGDQKEKSDAPPAGEPTKAKLVEPGPQTKQGVPPKHAAPGTKFKAPSAPARVEPAKETK